MKELWTSADIRRLFRLDERHKSIQSLYNAEEKKTIPKAQRKARGKVSVRYWEKDHIPSIGKKIGFLKTTENAKQIVFSKYIQKGGVFKTTTTYNEARTFALNGIKTLIIGGDPECSITDICLPRQEVLKLEEMTSPLGLFHFLVEDAPLSDVIKKTDLATLDIIPETHDLNTLDRWLNQQKRREYIYRDKLIPHLSEYDVIIFDNNPSWSHLVENSIVASGAVVCPMGCNLLAYNASETNIASIFEFQQEMQLHEQKIITYPTALNNSALSQQIYTQYLMRFSDYIINQPIKSTVMGEEALMSGQTIFEASPKSPLATQYYKLITNLWKILNQPFDEYIISDYSSILTEDD